MRRILNIEKVRYFIPIILLAIFATCNTGAKKNRLASAASPYLREHADNPVNWYEWGEEPLAIAKRENKPLLISIGYASCHWCHEMERESFMDTAIARIMNENFVCIKVDREERPDVDNLYMYACKLLTGGDGGWPLNAFALPNGKPFFAGTYYSNRSWKSLLTDIAKAYKEKHALVLLQADALTRGIANETLSFTKADSSESIISEADYRRLFDSVYFKIDTINGGIRGNPKFPMPGVIEALLQFHYNTGDKRALNAASNTLTKMALGGIYDQVGGGFARYAIDNQWRVPHFEKMLYDNAQLISAYSHAYQLTQNVFLKNIIDETILFIERELSSPEGGYYSSLNADTEIGEGAFYTWTMDEFKHAAGEEKQLAEYFNVTSTGNWKNGKNILSAASVPTTFAVQKGVTPSAFVSKLATIKARLLAERNKRNKPSVDSKMVTSWNAMMLQAYADAYVATGDNRYLTKAIAIANFIERNMIKNNRSIARIFSNEKVSVEGFLDDYAWTAVAFIKLYETTFNKHWADRSKQLVDFCIMNFYDRGAHLFRFSSGADSNIVVNNFETADESIPSSNAVMAKALQSIGVIYDDTQYLKISREMVRAVSGKLKSFPIYHSSWYNLASQFVYGTHQVAIVGRDAINKNIELQKNYLPDCIVMGSVDDENLPLLAGKLRANATVIYVCTNRVCKRPVEQVQEALKQISNKN